MSYERSNWPRVVVILLCIALCAGGFVVVDKLGISLPGSSANKTADDEPEKASVDDAIECKLNDSPIIKLNTEDRVQACKDAKKYAKAQLTKKLPAKLDEKYAKSESKLSKEIDRQFGCLDTMWDRESDWSAWAENPTSGAYGIAQIHPAIHGYPVKVGDWEAQVDWGLKYILEGYDTPCAALDFWNRTDPRCKPKANPCNSPFGNHWYRIPNG